MQEKKHLIIFSTQYLDRGKKCNCIRQTDELPQWPSQPQNLAAKFPFEPLRKHLTYCQQQDAQMWKDGGETMLIQHQ